MVQLGTPTYDGLRLNDTSRSDTLNPMHRLWSDGHWNSLTVAHGCYWKQCTFCDVGLDYIGRYETTPRRFWRTGSRRSSESKVGEASILWMRPLHPAVEGDGADAARTGGRHLLVGQYPVQEAFTPNLCRLLAASGCIVIVSDSKRSPTACWGK